MIGENKTGCETRPSLSLNQPAFEDVPLVKSVYAVFTRIPGESYRGRFSFVFVLNMLLLLNIFKKEIVNTF